MSIKLNIKNEVTGRMKVLAKNAENITAEGLILAGLALWDDTVNIAPKPPVDTGLLRGSGNLAVGNKKIPGPNSIDHDPAGDAGTITTGKGEAIFGLNTPYAARLHELPGYKSHKKPDANKDSGPGFVRQKLTRFSREYGRMMAEGVRRGLNKL